VTDKAYRTVPIAECNEPLAVIPPAEFAFTDPHPYVVLGAPYAGASPWQLRRGVLAALLDAGRHLTARRPGWRLKLFDAYRPVAVQAFMVWREFHAQAEKRGLSVAAFANPTELAQRSPDLYSLLADTVFTFWGMPSDDPRTPPPHSTGAAIDLTLQDNSRNEVDMGGAIDETTTRSYPDHYANTTSPDACLCHERRQLLNEVMTAAGFSRHVNEWWHFSLGDQMAAHANSMPHAIYGRAR
jgi:zinc D-Ala-D-Ala dipeptidase